MTPERCTGSWRKEGIKGKRGTIAKRDNDEKER